MSIKTTAAIALALLAFGGSAMAATHHKGARAYAPRQMYGATAPVPFNAYASTPDSYGYGRADVSAAEPGWNPSIDRAKGGL